MKMLELAIRLNNGEIITEVYPQKFKLLLIILGFTRVTPKLLERITRKYNNPELAKRFESFRDKRLQRLAVEGKFPNPQGGAIRSLRSLSKEKSPATIQSGKPSKESRKSRQLTRVLRKKTGTIVVPNQSEAYSMVVSSDTDNIPKGLTSKQVRAIKSGKSNRIIGLPSDASEEIILHEAGHNLSKRTIRDSDNYLYNNPKNYDTNTGNFLDDPATSSVNYDRLRRTKGITDYGSLVSDIGQVAEENLASAYALDRLKRSPDIRVKKENVDNALGTYVTNLKINELARTASRPMMSGSSYY